MNTLLVLCTLLGAPPDTSKAYFTGLQRPNARQVKLSRDGGPVILIVVDALRPDRLTPYGFARDTSPNISKLADEGIIFTNYFVNGNWTRPSTASLVTGLYPASHAVEREWDRLAEQFVTLAERLEAIGIPTGAVVGNGNAGSAFGLGRGFSYYADTTRHWEGLPKAEEVVDLALPFIDDHADEPFFLMLFFVDPHDPYHAPGKYENMFVSDLSVPLIRSPHWERQRYSKAQIDRMTATYDGAVRYTDAQIGRFFDSLRKRGIYDQATIIITSDHGEAFGEHGVFLHSHHMYDEIIRAPLVIRAPKMSRRGVYNHTLFQTVDVLPTIARAYGAKVPSDLPGLDIFRHLAEPDLANRDRVIISEFNNFGIRRRSIRTYRRKVIYSEPADEKEFMATVGNRELLPSVSFDHEQIQMFDLARDPFEKTDLFAEKGGVPGPRWARLLRILKRHRDLAPKPEMIHVVENIDPETLRDLKALGYIQ